jgi:hypothetical protein
MIFFVEIFQLGTWCLCREQHAWLSALRAMETLERLGYQVRIIACRVQDVAYRTM